MSARWILFVLSLGTCLAMTAQATEIDFSSQRDFDEINLNIKDQGRVDSAFVVLSVKLTPPARRRLENATRNALQQDLTLSLDGTPISTSTVQSVVKGARLQIVLSRQMARDVFPSLLATPVSSVSLSGFSMPEWTQGKWRESPAADAPVAASATGEALSIASKVLDADSCRRVNHTVVAASDSMVELRIDRRNKCVLDDVAVSKIILTRTPEAGRIVISLYAIGSDSSAAPARENTYLRQF